MPAGIILMISHQSNKQHALTAVFVQVHYAGCLTVSGVVVVAQVWACWP